MQALKKAALAALLATLAAQAQAPMPPNTIPLSTMMQQLSSKPGFTEAFLKQVEGSGGGKRGAALLTPALVDELRRVILGKDWQRLDHFPGWTMGQVNPTVRVIGHVAGKDPKVQDSATAGGAPSGQPGSEPHQLSSLTEYLDLGPYSVTSGDPIVLTKPSTLPGFNEKELVAPIGDGVVRGDGPSPLASTHADSQRLADTLNRLAINGMSGVMRTSAVWHRFGQGDKPVLNWYSPEDLIGAIAASGNTVTVTDSRYFANFGHLHFKGQDVMMPFYLNTLIEVPGQHRPLLVPVSHAEYEWHIRGPQMNADVSFYFGIDGHAEWRTMDQLDQAWVMKRDAHTYTGADAVEVTRLNGEIVQTYERLHQAHSEIPFGGYYAFGVCQDVVAAVEMKLTGKTTLFPNTADESFFTDPADREINDLIRRLPKDRNGRPPQVERVFGSLPVGQSDAELATVMIPGLGADLIAVHDAWTNGTLKRIRPRHRLRNSAIALGVLLLVGLLYWIHRRRNRA